jgi:hypothetical protein
MLKLVIFNSLFLNAYSLMSEIDCGSLAGNRNILDPARFGMSDLQLPFEVDTPHHPAQEPSGGIDISAGLFHGIKLIWSNRFVKDNRAFFPGPNPCLSTYINEITEERFR